MLLFGCLIILGNLVYYQSIVDSAKVKFGFLFPNISVYFLYLPSERRHCYCGYR